jgi:hypothetical protein
MSRASQQKTIVCARVKDQRNKKIKCVRHMGPYTNGAQGNVERNQAGLGK